jgi:hypothetical protein
MRMKERSRAEGASAQSHEARVFPSWDRRGGGALKKKFPFRSGADGVVNRDEMFRNAFLQHSPRLTTPAAPFNRSFAAFS